MEDLIFAVTVSEVNIPVIVEVEVVDPPAKEKVPAADNMATGLMPDAKDAFLLTH